MSSVSTKDLINFVNERCIGKEKIMMATDPDQAHLIPNDEKYYIMSDLIQCNDHYFVDNKPSTFPNYLSFKIMLQLLDNLIKGNEDPDIEEIYLHAIHALTNISNEHGTDVSLVGIINEVYNTNKTVCMGYVRKCVPLSQNADFAKYFANIIYDFQFETNFIIQKLMQYLWKPTQPDFVYYPEEELRTISRMMNESEIYPFLSNSMDDIMKDLINYHSILKLFKSWLPVTPTEYNENTFKALIFRILTVFMKRDASVSMKIRQCGLFEDIVNNIGYVDDDWTGYAEDDALECLILFIQTASEKDLRYVINVEIDNIFVEILKYINICGCCIRKGSEYCVGIYKPILLLQRLLTLTRRIIQFGDEQTMKSFEKQKGVSIIGKVKLCVLQHKVREHDVGAVIESCDNIINLFQ